MTSMTSSDVWPSPVPAITTPLQSAIAVLRIDNGNPGWWCRSAMGSASLSRTWTLRPPVRLRKDAPGATVTVSPSVKAIGVALMLRNAERADEGIFRTRTPRWTAPPAPAAVRRLRRRGPVARAPARPGGGGGGGGGAPPPPPSPAPLFQPPL